MPYRVKEVFHSICGEGFHAGRAAVFVRFSGCNLWSGREADRTTAACRFCDTDFVGGVRMSLAEVVGQACRSWGEDRREAWCVLTGGEPALQADAALIDELRREGFGVAIETNGTVPLPAGLDWTCVSPKAGVPLAVRAGDELKVVFPQSGLDLATLEGLAFAHRYVQPMDGPEVGPSTRAAVAFVLENPRWRLSEQRHKRIGAR